MENRRARATPVAAGRGRWRTRIVALIVAGAVVVVSVLVAVSVLVVHAGYEMTHDLPNPYWGIFNRGYSYTPEQGPPNAVLLDTRPDVIAMQFLHDYLAVAGTYPCVEQLAGYNEDEGYDPVIEGQPCGVHRQVREMWVTRVTVSEAVLGFLRAVVHYEVDYADGTRLAGAFHMSTLEHSKAYYLARTHANCWRLLPLIGFYSHRSVTPPRGAEYYTAEGIWHCVGVY